MLPGFVPVMMMADASGGGGGGGYAGGALDTQTVTIGADGNPIDEDRRRGFMLGQLGAIVDGTSNLYAGAAIRRISAQEFSAGVFDVYFEVAGVVANAGWTSINIGGAFTLNRAAAGFITVTGNSVWRWASAGGPGTPFGVSGTKVVGFD